MEKKDILDRKVDGLGKLWGFFSSDPIRFICFLSIIANIILTDKLIKNTEEMSKAIIEEVRKQVPREVEEQLVETKAKVDTVSERLLEAIPKKQSEYEEE